MSYLLYIFIKGCSEDVYMMGLHDFYNNIQSRVLCFYIYKEREHILCTRQSSSIHTLSFLSVCCFLSLYSVSNFTLRLFCFFSWVFSTRSIWFVSTKMIPVLFCNLFIKNFFICTFRDAPFSLEWWCYPFSSGMIVLLMYVST